MDNFMERISHRYDATDMIKANSEAEAAQADAQKEQLMLFEAQMNKVDLALSNIREVNMKNIESAESVQELAKTTKEGLSRAIEESIAKIESIKEMADPKDAIETSVNALKEALVAMRKETEDYMHTDHVKIYRNVQMAVTEELNKKTDEIKAECHKKGALLPLLIITLISSLSSVALIVLRILGIL
ncbi:MAG: hypothetical protein MJZ11_09265 [Lachnospiraceae bacterium]|nr:hypothetical protein [Lachnospiraceae bacterium]